MKTGIITLFCFLLTVLSGFCSFGNAALTPAAQPAERGKVAKPAGTATTPQTRNRPAAKTGIRAPQKRLLPDLVIEKIWLQRGFIAFRLKNAGRGSIPGNEHRQAKIKVGTRSYSLATVDPKGILKHPGRTVNYTTAVKPAPGSGKSVVTVTVIADCTHKIHELNEGNNTRTATLRVTGRMPAAKTRPTAGRAAAGATAANLHQGFAHKHSLMPAIAVEKMYLRHGTIHVRLRNRGKTAFTRAHLYPATLQLSMGSKTHTWHLTDIDHGRHLWRPGGSFDFDTGLHVDRPIRIVARLDKTAKTMATTAMLRPRHTQTASLHDTGTDNSANQVASRHPSATRQTMEIPRRSISVVQPDGGEEWHSGKSYAILWRSENLHGNIRIRLLADNGSYSKILARHINADLGRALVSLPSDVPTGMYKIRIESLDHSIHDESNTVFTILGKGGFTLPDLQIADIRHLVHPERITVRIRNNGTQWHGVVQLRVIYHDPHGPYTETRNSTVELDLGPGEDGWFDILNPFRWQNPLDMPRLTFLVQVDPDGNIRESNENNNQLLKKLAIPCGLHISSLSHTWLYEGLEAQMFLYGSFGSERKTKTVGVLDADNHLHKVFPRVWEPGSLKVDLQNFATGRYRFVVYCSDPDEGSAYASNISSWIEIRKPEYHSSIFPFPHESPIDVKKIAKALSEEFLPDGTATQLHIERIWVEHVSDGWKMHAIIPYALLVSPQRIEFEIWAGATRIRYGAVTSFHKNSSGRYHESFVFQGLHDGTYTLKCNLSDDRSNQNQKSLQFTLSGTQVRTD